MEIKLKQLYDIVGERVRIDYFIDELRLKEIKNVGEFCDVHVTGELFNKASVLNLMVSVVFTLKTVCDRCLDEIQKEIVFEFGHILVRETNTDSDEFIVTDGDIIDLDELILADILLQLPSKMLCNEECKGLCFTCGANLNKNECNCND